MPFTERAKRTALAIVKIFETAKPFGRYDALVVDHAGISFGVSQFTHASGSLYAVLNRAKKLGAIFPIVVEEALGDFAAKRNVAARGRQEALRAALIRLGSDPRVQQAQREIAYEKYLAPAIEACEGSYFVCPLSLAVVYDSITHGSFAKIRDRVTVRRLSNGSMKEIEFEKEWITEYVRRRDRWLENHRIPLLRKTDYRTDFFLAQIARDNWGLDLPLNVHGIRLTEEILFPGGDPDAQADAIAFNPTDEELDAALDGAISGYGETESATAFDDSTPAPPAVEDATFQEPLSDPQQSAESLPTQNAGQVEGGFVTETVTVDAPPPTGFIGKLKAQGIALFAGIGGLAGLKEWFQVQISPETLSLLTVAIPTVLGLGFLGLIVWYVSEKVIGFKTLKMQAMYAADPDAMAVNIRPMMKSPKAGIWRNVEYGDPNKPPSVVP